MGAPSHHDPDRGAAPNAEVPIDEGWSAPAQVHNDQTTAGLYVGPASTKVMPRGPSTTGFAEGTDQILAELQRADAVADSEQMEAVDAASPDADVTLVEPHNDMVRDEKAPELVQPVLVQPERSPLDLVMRELESAAPQQTSASNDSSKFIMSLMGDQPPPRVDTESPVIAAMQPVSRLRRQRTRVVAAGALAVVVLGVASAVMLSRGDDKPRAAASEAAHVTESPTPTPLAAVAPPSNIATPMVAAENEVPAPSEPSNAPVAAEVRPEPSPEPTAPAKLAIATKADTAATRTAVKPANTRSTSSKRPTAKKALALKEPTAKKPSAAKTSRKKPAQKTTTTKVTATKTSAVKKSSTVAKRKTKK
jgi:hypothetical protein